MRLRNAGVVFCVLLLLIGCVKTVGDIRDNKFYDGDSFSVDLLGDDWEIMRQKMTPGDPLFPSLHPARYSTNYEISFAHKKSSGFIGVDVRPLSDVGKQRSLDIIADSVVSDLEGVKLSQKKVTVDGIDAIEVVQSGKRLLKVLIFKTGEKIFYVQYTNTPAYFDQNLPVFDKFVASMKILKR